MSYSSEDKARLRRLYDEATADGGKPDWATVATPFPRQGPVGPAADVLDHEATTGKEEG